MFEKAVWKPVELSPATKWILPPGSFARVVQASQICKMCNAANYARRVPIQLAYLACTEDRWVSQNGSGLP